MSVNEANLDVLQKYIIKFLRIRGKWDRDMNTEQVKYSTTKFVWRLNNCMC